MRVSDLDRYYRSIFEIDGLQSLDASMNGAQVGDLDGEVKKIAFAVDAAIETIRRAVDWDADMLFVHHGLFWGHDIPVTGDHYRRVKLLLDANLALYAVHLPLDKHLELGNNAQMAKCLGLEEVRAFGEYKGVEIGVAGCLPQPMTTNAIAKTLFGADAEVLSVLPFGPQESSTVAIVSGGAPYEVDEAIAGGMDLYITGDASHTIYHRCLEAGINVIFGGHYLTETWGPRAIMERTQKDTGVETRFIDLPTGL